MSSTAKKSRLVRKPTPRNKSGSLKKGRRPPKSTARKSRSTEVSSAREPNGARPAPRAKRAPTQTAPNRKRTFNHLDAQLTIINSIQQGLASRLDFQAIVDLVGDKLRDVFKTNDLGVRWYDEKANLAHILYALEHGKRLSLPPGAPAKGGLFEKLKKARRPIVLNTADQQGTPAPGTEAQEVCHVWPPSFDRELEKLVRPCRSLK